MARELGIGMECGNEVSGHIHLGQNIDMAFGSITHHVLHLFLGVVERTVWTVCLCTFACPVHLSVLLNLGDRSVITATALSTFAREQGILLYLGTPSLVVGQMPMEYVHLVYCHQIQHFLYLLHGEEMTAYIKHETTV